MFETFLKLDMKALIECMLNNNGTYRPFSSLKTKECSKEEIERFKWAWDILSGEQRQLLEDIYIKKMPMAKICENWHFEKTYMYNLRYKTFETLERLLREGKKKH